MPDQVQHHTLFHSFKQAADPQTSSPLLSLPDEIWVEVLCNLMKCEYILCGCDNLLALSLDRQSPYQSSVNLSSQVLACCQKLYREGKHILYDMNELEVICNNTTPRPPAITFLNRTRYLGDAPNCSSQAVVCSGYYERIDRHLRPRKPTNIPSHQVEVENFSGLFVRIQVVSQLDLFIACRQLAGIVKGKWVRVEVNCYNERYTTWLGAFLIWRCESFKFEGACGPAAGALTEIIQSSRPVYDTLRLGQMLDRVVRYTALSDPVWLSHTAEFESAVLNNEMEKIANVTREYLAKTLVVADKRKKRVLLKRLRATVSYFEETDGELLPYRNLEEQGKLVDFFMSVAAQQPEGR